MKFADGYEMVKMENGIYVFIVYIDRRVRYGVWIDLNEKNVEVTKDNMEQIPTILEDKLSEYFPIKQT